MFFLNHKMKKLFILLVIGIISSLQTLSWSVEPDKDLVLYLPMEKDLLDASGTCKWKSIFAKRKIWKGY